LVAIEDLDAVDARHVVVASGTDLPRSMGRRPCGRAGLALQPIR